MALELVGQAAGLFSLGGEAPARCYTMYRVTILY